MIYHLQISPGEWSIWECQNWDDHEEHEDPADSGEDVSALEKWQMMIYSIQKFCSLWTLLEKGWFN